jgi:hypothetical protein
VKDDLILSASDKLDLLEIALHSFSLVRNENYDPEIYPDNMEQQSKLSVQGEVFSYVLDSGDSDSVDQEQEIFRAFVNLGVRGIDSDESLTTADDESIVCFTLEAVFRIDYLMHAELSDEEANAFLEFNSVHNAWPFWRQFVFQAVNSAKLPNLNIPLMKGKQVASKNKNRKSKKHS